MNAKVSASKIKKKAKPEAEISKTVRNALELLQCFSHAQPVLTASELARRLKIPRTNVIRLLATLERYAFIQRRSDGSGFSIGLRAFEIGALFMAANPTMHVLQKALDRIVEDTHCTAYLAVLDRDDAVILMCREGTLPIRFIWQIGDRLPCTTTALGKAMLAHLTEQEIDAILGENKPLRTLTKNSLRTRKELARDLKLARGRGWAFVSEESHAGLTAVGAAILDRSRKPIAAISVSYLNYPPDEKRAEQYGVSLSAIAAEISQTLSEYERFGTSLAREVAARATN